VNLSTCDRRSDREQGFQIHIGVGRKAAAPSACAEKTIIQNTAHQVKLWNVSRDRTVFSRQGEPAVPASAPLLPQPQELCFALKTTAAARSSNIPVVLLSSFSLCKPVLLPQTANCAHLLLNPPFCSQLRALLSASPPASALVMVGCATRAVRCGVQAKKAHDPQPSASLFVVTAKLPGFQPFLGPDEHLHADAEHLPARRPPSSVHPPE